MIKMWQSEFWKNASNLEYDVQNNMIVQRYLDLSVFPSSNSKNGCKSIYIPLIFIFSVYILCIHGVYVQRGRWGTIPCLHSAAIQFFLWQKMCFYFPKSRSSLFLSFCQTKQTITIIHQYINCVIKCSSNNNFLLDIL